MLRNRTLLFCNVRWGFLYKPVEKTHLSKDLDHGVTCEKGKCHFDESDGVLQLQKSIHATANIPSK